MIVMLEADMKKIMEQKNSSSSDSSWISLHLVQGSGVGAGACGPSGGFPVSVVGWLEGVVQRTNKFIILQDSESAPTVR